MKNQPVAGVLIAYFAIKYIAKPYLPLLLRIHHVIRQRLEVGL